jgi:3-deoxy-7-phosphoheptulonate synthase
MRRIENLNVIALTPLITPEALKKQLPLTPTARETIASGRESVHAILDGTDPRFLVIAGPCSIHDTAVALEYAERLGRLAEALKTRLCILMRTYFEKPRTTIGWKGLIYAPRLDGEHDIPAGLFIARELLLKIAEMGQPIGTELLDPIVPQYIADLVSWASIGARTTESQTHREMASGFSMPIGFKNSTDGNLQVAIDAMISARGKHHFLGIDGQGQSCVVETRGNPASHLILRGGRGRPNYDPVSVIDAIEHMKKANLPPRIVVDCSHANCGKRYELQAHVLRDVVQQRVEGNAALLGVMLESNLKPGNQPMPEKGRKLEYGVSVTDPCLGWETTEELLRQAYDKLGAALP